MLSNPHQQEINQHIEQILNKPLNFIDCKPTSGGDINTCYTLHSSEGNFFLKTNNKPIATDMFAAEFEGLCDLRRQNSLTIPEPLLFGEFSQGGSFLLMGALTLGGPKDWRKLAEGLVDLHKLQSQSFGWNRNNFIGTIPQQNSTHASWANFWWEERLQPQLEMAYTAGYSKALKPFENALEILSQNLLNHSCQPSLVHGDLWRGNVDFCQSGQPCLYDPAPYYGDREVDLALSQLFGGFAEEFYRHYQTLWPLEKGYQQRFVLYNLYHLFNHLNLFGSAYLSQCMSSIQSLLR